MVRLRLNGRIIGRTTSTPNVHFGYPIAALPVNQAPVASFTTARTDLTVTVTSTSTDPDGSITSYAWAWGDGATSTGATASHTYTTGGTYTVTLTVTDNQGATASTTAQVTPARPVVADPYTFTTSTGQSARIDFPAGWSSSTAVPLVIQSRGVDFNVGGNTFEQPTMSDAALAAGWAFATCAFHGNSYGSPAALADLTALITEAQRVATIGPVVLWGNSMGGMLALNAVTTGTLTPAGVYLTDPVVDLRQRYDNGRAGTIQTAYGIASDGSDYATKTAGYDPALRAAGDYLPANLRFRSVASTGDTQVPMSLHTHVLESKLGSTRVNARDIGDAGHNTAARFIPSDFTAFLTSVLTPDVTAPTAPTLTATPGNTTVALSWTAATDTIGTVRYRVKRGTTVLTPIAVTGTTYTDTGRTNGTSLTYTVEAINAQGLVTPSNTATATPAAPATNTAPTASFTRTITDLTVTATSTSTDSDGTIASTSWGWGDGATTTGTPSTHTYATPGTYTVTLTVTDDAGASSVATSSVTVTAPVLVVDNFDTAGNLPGSTTSAGGKTWTAVAASTGNAVAATELVKSSGTVGTKAGGTAVTTVAYVDAGSTSYTVEVTLSAINAAVGSRGGGLAVRVGSNGFFLWLNTRVSSTVQGYAVYKQQTGTATAVAGQQSTTIIPTVGDRLKAVVTPTTVAFYVNGTQIGTTITDSLNNTSTNAGIFWNASAADNRYDDFARTA